MRRTRKALAVVAVGTAVALLGSGVALADEIENDIIGVTTGSGAKTTTTYTKDYTAGTPAVAVGFFVVNTNSGGNPDCDATPASPLYLTIAQVTGINVALPTPLSSVPNEVGEANRTRTLKFEACSVTQYADFSTAWDFAPGSYNIGTSFYDGAGRYTNDSAFTLRVAAGTSPAKQQQSSLTVVVADAGAYGDRLALSASGGDGTGAVSYSTGTSDACAVGTGSDAAKLVVTKGTGSCAVTATKAGDSSFESTTSQPKSVAVSPKALTGSFTTPVSKVYDGGTAAVVSTRSLSGVINNDTVTLDGGAATFANKNVGTGKMVTLAGATLGGTGAGNYALTSVATQLAAITQKGVTGSFTANNKVYDRTDAATIASQTVTGVMIGDAVALGGTAKFDNANVGTGKTVTLHNPSLTGTDAGNYNLNPSVPGTTANITAQGVIVTFTSTDKVYDGNTGAAVIAPTASGVRNGDDVTVTGGSAGFADKNAGNGKTVTGAGFSLDGAQAGNYSIDSIASTTANITKKAIGGSFTAANREYDGGTAATITSSGLGTGTITGDVLSLNASQAAASFADKTAANTKTVTSTGFALAGGDSGNYALTMGTTTANITPKAIGGNFTAGDKVYDGGTAATITSSGLGTGTITGDVLSLNASQAAASFADKTAANTKTVTSTGFALAGGDSGNYALTMGTTTANITPKAIGGNFTAGDKVYDGGTAATITSSGLGTGTITGDVLSLNASQAAASFADKTAANTKTVTSTGFALAGGDSGNYALTMGTTTANITPKAISGSFTAANKEYDGNTNAVAVNKELAGTISGDLVGLIGGTATFDTKDVGSNKAVRLTGASLTGTDAGNYELTSVSDATADITRKALTITASSPTGVKAGDPVPTIAALYSGFVADDNADNSLDPKPTCGTNYTQQSGGGTFSTSCSGAGSVNYAPTYVNGTFSALFNFGGFQAPLNALPTRNTVKAGRAVPVKFKLGGDFGTRIFANSTEISAGGPKTASTICGTNATDPVEETLTAGSSSLSYDANTGEYTFVWKTESAWAGTCRTFSLNLKDGSNHVVSFQLTK